MKRKAKVNKEKKETGSQDAKNIPTCIKEY